MVRPEIGLVIFDWAGTVIDFGCLAPAGAFVRAFGQLDINVSIAEARGPMGLHKKDHIRELLKHPDIAKRWQAKTRRDWMESDVEDLYRRVTPLQVAAAREHSRLISGAIECVAELRALGLKIAGTTGYFREAAEVCYTAAKDQGYQPDYLICADEVPAGRPKPWMIFRCLEALDIYPPRRVIKVGDTVIDIEDGRNAGVWSVAVVDSSSEMGLSEGEFAALAAAERNERRRNVRNKFESARADATFDSLAELPHYIRGLNRRLTDSL